MFNPIHKTVDPNVLVPLDYWKEGATFPPDDSAGRYEQLTRYTDLFQGNFDSILPQDWLYPENDPVQENLFHLVADLRTRFLMAAPPEAPIDSELADELFDTMHDVLYNYTIYGTGIFYVYRDGTPHIESVNPTNWFPAEGGDALVWELADTYEVHILTPEKNTRITFERRNGVRRLGKQLGDTEEYPPLASRQIFPCGNRPKHGEWGTSIIPQIGPLVVEIVKINSRTSDIHENSSEPFLFIERGVPTDAERVARGAAQKGATRGMKDQIEALRIGHQRKRGVIRNVNGKITAVPTLADTQDMREQAKALMNKVYVLTATPVNFLGSQDGFASTPVSGETIRRGNAYAEVTLESIQKEVLKCANKALSLVERRDIELDWKNPFEELDEDRESDNLRDLE